MLLGHGTAWLDVPRLADPTLQSTGSTARLQTGPAPHLVADRSWCARLCYPWLPAIKSTVLAAGRGNGMTLRDCLCGAAQANAVRYQRESTGCDPSCFVSAVSAA